MSSIRKITESRSQDFSHKRILLVDDHSHIRAILTSILNGLGLFDLTTADRADRALQRLESEPIDIVITDFRMPGMSGITLAHRIRAEARSRVPRFNAAMPIIMITSFGTKKCLVAARDAGIDEFLAKPFTTIGLAERLDAVLNMQREFIVSEDYIGPCRRRKVDPLLMNLKRRRADHMPTLDLPDLDLADFDVRERPWTPTDNAAEQRSGAVAPETVLGANQLASKATPNLDLRDDLLQRAANSLIKYVALTSPTGDLDDDIVEMHGLAVKQLIDLAGRDMKLSHQVVDSLERAVVKRTTSKKRAG
jgi:CheY-like chemotaxis protein